MAGSGGQVPGKQTGGRWKVSLPERMGAGHRVGARAAPTSPTSPENSQGPGQEAAWEGQSGEATQRETAAQGLGC